MSSIREMRSTTQTGTIKPNAAASFTGGTTSIRKLRAQKLPTQTSVGRTAPITAPQQRLLDVPDSEENPAQDTQGTVLCVIDLNAAEVLAKAKLRSFSKCKLSFVTDQGAAMPPCFLPIVKA